MKLRMDIRNLCYELIGRFHARHKRLPEIDLKDLVGDTDIKCNPILEKSSMPPYSEGGPPHDDFTPLMRLIAAWAPQLVLELGTAYGNLTANLCHHFPQIKVLTVDVPATEQTGHLTTFQLRKNEIGMVYRQWGYEARVEQILANTLNLRLGDIINTESIDIVIIDACHDTRYVLNDFYKVLPFVRHGGLVLFHDTHPSMKGHLKGSYLACLILHARGFDIAHIRGTWWAAWVKNIG